MAEKSRIEREILKKLKTGKGFSYNELRGGFLPSSKFAYHLGNLLSRKIIEKTPGKSYCLTDRGMELMSKIEGSTGERANYPIVCAYVLVAKGPGRSRILLKERANQPFLGYLGVVGGKVRFGSEPEGEAGRELLEETGLEAELNLKLITNLVTLNAESGKCVHHAVGFWYLGSNPRGKLIRSQREGKNSFMTVSEMLKKKRIPDLDFIVPAILSGKSPVRFANILHEMRDGKFVKTKVLSDSRKFRRPAFLRKTK
ncbi:MAG: NUDIX domain-containing protein [archaeon]